MKTPINIVMVLLPLSVIAILAIPFSCHGQQKEKSMLSFDAQPVVTTFQNIDTYKVKMENLYLWGGDTLTMLTIANKYDANSTDYRIVMYKLGYEAIREDVYFDGYHVAVVAQGYQPNGRPIAYLQIRKGR